MCEGIGLEYGVYGVHTPFRRLWKFNVRLNFILAAVGTELVVVVVVVSSTPLPARILSMGYFKIEVKEDFPFGSEDVIPVHTHLYLGSWHCLPIRPMQELQKHRPPGRLLEISLQLGGPVG